MGTTTTRLGLTKPALGDTADITVIDTDLDSIDTKITRLEGVNTATSAMTLDLSAASDTAGLKLPSKAGAAPTADGFLAFDTTAHRPVVGENGSTLALATVTGTETLTNKTLGTGTVVTAETMTLGSDATGDIYYRAAGGALTRLAVGTGTQFLVGGTVPAWGTPTAGPTVMAFTTGNSTVSAGSTVFIGLAGAGLATEANAAIPAPTALTFTKMYITCSGAATAGQSFTYTLRKNASDTTITTSISGASAQSANDTAHSVSFAAGDTIDVKLVTSGSAAAVIHQVSLSTS